MFDLKIRNNVIPTLVTFENAPVDDTTVTNKLYVDTLVSTSVAAKTITLTGDVIGSGNSSFNTILSNTGVTAGTYSTVTVNTKGRVTSAGQLFISGDASGTSVNGSLSLLLANSGVVAGTYNKVTVDSKGRVTSGGTLSSSDITTALGYTPLNNAGGTIVGNLILGTQPTQPNHAVTKAYIDSKIWLAIAVGY